MLCGNLNWVLFLSSFLQGLNFIIGVLSCAWKNAKKTSKCVGHPSNRNCVMVSIPDTVVEYLWCFIIIVFYHFYTAFLTHFLHSCLPTFLLQSLHRIDSVSGYASACQLSQNVFPGSAMGLPHKSMFLCADFP